MSKSSVRPVALLTILLLMVLFAWGCGSGDEQTTTTTVAVPTTLPPLVEGDTDPLVGTVLLTGESTPVEYTDAVAQGRPVVMLFYVPGGSDDQKVLESIQNLQPAFSDYLFLLYDYKSPNAYGDLSTLLDVNYPPELVLVDATGTISEIWNGYVDEGTINQSLVNLGGG